MSEKIPHWLIHQATVHPNKTALHFKEQRWTYKQLTHSALKLVQHFHDVGISSGDHVGVLSKNSPGQIQSFLALSLIGAIIVPLKRRLKPPELKYQIEEAECSIIITQEDLLPSLPEDIPSVSFPDLQHQSNKLSPDLDSDHAIATEECMTIFYTSGTTGAPKGVELTHRNFLYSAMANAINMGIRADDLWLACLPLDHIGGFSILTRTIIQGTTMLLQEQFEVDETLRLLESNPVTIVSLVPTMLKRLLEAGLDIHNTSLRAILLGGAAPQPQLVTEALERGLPVLRSYGMTETCSQVMTTPLHSIHSNYTSSGKPLPFTRIKILDESGNETASDTAGEIYLLGPTIMHGYWNNSKATEEAFDHGGWFRTGDFGYLDEEQNLYTVSRRENLIVTGGENVYPEEVESVLNSYPAIVESCVFGIEDIEWGQKVIAAIQFVKKTEPDTDEIRQYLSKRLARYKLPKDFFLVKQFPKTNSGKLKRDTIRQQYLSNE